MWDISCSLKLWTCTFGTSFIKEGNAETQEKNLRDSDPVFSHLQTGSQETFSVRLEDTSQRRFLKRKNANDLLKFLRLLEAKCNIVPSAIHLHSALWFSLLILIGSSAWAAITHFPSGLLSYGS